MDGFSILLVISGLFLAKAYGVAVPPSSFFSMGIMIILISLGCPGIPGVIFVCLAVVLQDLGVPIESMGMIMGVMPIIDMTCTVTNTTGDVAATLIIAKSEGLVDVKKFES
ncbi:MAG: cation:dicarboxylase symporter family transporter [Lachnospiraceae bacterium]|nr:cation:dicarboxylase symporter family transporter [Lachnospiraceae bacterium]